MVAALTASVGPLDYRTARLKPREWPAWCSLVLFQLGNFATTAAVLSLRDCPSFGAVVRMLPDWLTRAGVDLPIFCWIGHSLALVVFIAVLSGGDADRSNPSDQVSRGLFACLVAGMLYPLVLAGGVRLWAACSGGGGEGAAIACLSPALAVIACLALVRESSEH
jgi:energy-converting hydrogenase Eha subunit E